ncbi:MAG TPA: hypothetical protein VGS14_11135 [Actinomycetes bacterium]|nr:hypothetical protein [Actinomycetes bacterium]
MEPIRSVTSRSSDTRPLAVADGSYTDAQESTLPPGTRARLKPIPVVPHCQGTV